LNTLIVHGVDIAHSRLVDLTRLADQAEPFYHWVELTFRRTLHSQISLESLLQTLSRDQIEKCIIACYAAADEPNLPLLFDGVGRSYSHAKACYYFFAWLIRDAPQQRLAPMIQRMVRVSGVTKAQAEARALATLIVRYRLNVRTFGWDAIREVIIDRLEGSRRSIKGHEKESIVRTALLAAIQAYFTEHDNYGIYAKVMIAENQVMIGNESFDVSVNLMDKDGKRVSRILVPIKTRETEGGGHSHLFTRDIMSALGAARFDSPGDFLVAVIVAKNWSNRETETIRRFVDHLTVFDVSPNEFIEFGNTEQHRLDQFVEHVLNGRIEPKIVQV